MVEPHLNVHGGDLPAVFSSAERGEASVPCAQGVAPEAATIDRFRSLGQAAANPRAMQGYAVCR